MPDISTLWDTPNSRGDYVVSGPDLASGNDLVTALLISVFTDRIADPDDVIPDGSGDPRGWWGDLGQAVPVGSRLWELERSKQLPDVLRRAKAYLTEATRWMLDDGAAGRIDIATEFTRPEMLGCEIVLWPPAGTPIQIRFPNLWGPAPAAFAQFVQPPVFLGTEDGRVQGAEGGEGILI